MKPGAASEPVGTPLISLDILRAAAAFTVLVVHTRSFSWVDYGLLPAAQHNALTAVFWMATRIGDEAVMVFFVLSGLLVGGRVVERVRAGRFDTAAYVVDRATRILIPLIPACLLTAAIAALVMHKVLGIGDVAANMFGLNGVLAPTLDFNASLWSLSYEIWFYVLAGAAAHWIAKGPGLIAGAVILAATLCFAKLGSTYLLFWSLGALMIFGLRTTRPRLLLAVGVPIALLGAALYELGVASRSFARLDIAPPDVAKALICFGVSLALPFLCRPGVNRAIAWLRKPAAFVSGFSYSLYLTHYPVVMALAKVLPQSPAIDLGSMGLFVLRLAICVAVAIVFYLAFESRTGTARRWLGRRGFGVPAAHPLAQPAARADAV
jgi:peptidoglycan/LPS O-acetylase OafA/YrhL